MKAITLWQPWATLIAIGAKEHETRSWPTKYRGMLAIHAAKTFPKEEQELCRFEPFKSDLDKSGLVVDGLPRGAIVATANLIDCIKITEEYISKIVGTKEYDYGDYEVDKYVWILKDVRNIKAIPAKGKQGLWNWDDVPESL